MDFIRRLLRLISWPRLDHGDPAGARNQRGCKAASLEDWFVVGSSVRGVAHVKNGLPCQDSHAWRRPCGDIILVAVADGAGSAAYADQGSKLAVHSSLEALEAGLSEKVPAEKEEWRALLNIAFETARKALLDQANVLGSAAHELASTLLVAALSSESLASMQVGDGCIVVQTREGTLEAVSTPMNGEYANETVFLTSGNALQKMRFSFRAACLQGLALLTDGLQRLALKMPEATPHSPFFDPLLRFAKVSRDDQGASKQLTHFLESPRVTDRADDDLTLVLAVTAESKQMPGEWKSA
jgi:hypothetical protein